MPTVSVIIPLFNKSRYIRRALDSVFAQRYRDYEIIVVDDGSTDQSFEIVRQYKDKRLRFIRQDNAGPGAARNKGIRQSEAALLAFLDADDEWMPEFLQKSVITLQSNPDCDLTASSYFLGEKRIDVSPIYKKRGAATGPRKLQKDMSVREIIYAYYLLNSWAILCKREVIEKYGLFRTKDRCSYGEDTYLWLQVMFNHKIYRIMEPLVWYHSEASQLGPGRCNEEPLQSFLTDPKSIRKSCPSENRQLLELFLARFALATAHKYTEVNGQDDKLKYLIDAYPEMKRFRWDYTKLKLKMKVPGLIGPVRRVKNRLHKINN